MKFLFVFLASVFTLASAVPWVGEPRFYDWWHERHLGFVENTLNSNGSIRVLFYGDSITEGWGGNGREIFDEYYTPLGTANYGIGGDRTESVLWRIADGEVTENLNPAVCIIKIGTNNVYFHSVEEIAMGVAFNIIELRERLPNTKILLLGVLPRNDEGMTNVTSAINEIIKHLDNGNTVRYLDMKNHFFQNGEVVKELYTEDLVHLSTAGYRKWAEVMDPLFREMLNSTQTI